ncbi:MAG TPA: Stp1/IreP family PP2C-type Ser/Thr phosphatase [Actinomycetota bacterium]|nr:Stp1/IreP family PP2C-type Ser/Thr phosphatase [Actinomycetota bacterium]
MRVTVGAATDIGQVRDGNEDSYLLLDPLYAVADGMGGHLGGEVASNLALDTIRERFEAGDRSLVDHVALANRVVFERSQRDRDVRGMGTTLTAALVEGARVRLVHVGDSRAYLLRDGRLSIVTKDHTVVAKMVEEGEISAAEAETHPHRNIVTRVVGVESTVQADEGILDVRDGDRLLLCSDGLSGMVPHDDIAEVLRTERDPQAAVDALVRAANAAGGVDNITAVLLEFADDGPADDRAAVAATEGPPTVRRRTAEHPMAAPQLAAAPGGEPDGSASASWRAEAGAQRPLPSRSRPSAASGARRAVIGLGVTLALFVLGFVGLRVYLDSQWYVGISNGRVAIFRGVPTEVAGFELNSLVVETQIPAAEATSLEIYRETLPEGITATDRADAESIVDGIERDVDQARPDRT